MLASIIDDTLGAIFNEKFEKLETLDIVKGLASRRLRRVRDDWGIKGRIRRICLLRPLCSI